MDNRPVSLAAANETINHFFEIGLSPCVLTADVRSFRDTTSPRTRIRLGLPRPPARKVDRRVKVVFNEVIVAEQRAYRILETSHPPVYYMHPQDVRMDLLEIGPQSFCEYKGQAKYWSLLVDGKLSKNAAWSYP